MYLTFSWFTCFSNTCPVTEWKRSKITLHIKMSAFELNLDLKQRVKKLSQHYYKWPHLDQCQVFFTINSRLVTSIARDTNKMDDWVERREANWKALLRALVFSFHLFIGFPARDRKLILINKTSQLRLLNELLFAI